MIEKRVWFLWLQGIDEAPPLVQRCLESWRFWNPEWRVEFVDGRRLPSLLPEYPRWAQIPPAARSDLVRLNLLSLHGGVWTDATCLCRKPLDTWLPPLLGAGFFAFADPGPLRPLSTWFLATEPDSMLIEHWRNAAHAYWEHGVGRSPVDCPTLFSDPHYAEHRRNTGLWLDPERQELYTHYPYFWVHFLFAQMLRDADLAARWRAVPKITANIPHRLHKLGLEHPINPTLAREIRYGMAPLYKLSHKSGLDIDDRSTLLGYCLDPANW